MKFIKLLSKHTDAELQKMLTGFSESEIEYIENIYFKMDYVEFIDKYGFVGMFFSAPDHLSKKLIDFYVDKSIKFSFEDLTKDVLFDNKIDIDEYKPLHSNKNLSLEVNELIDRFYEDNIDSDTILDKINEKGIASLKEIDKKVLK